MGLVWAKVGGAVAIAALTLAANLLPRVLFVVGKKWLAVANAFGAGVFLGAVGAFVLPDVSADLQGSTPHYPSGFVLVIIGYLGLLLLDRVALPHRHEEDAQADGGAVALATLATPPEDLESDSLILRPQDTDADSFVVHSMATPDSPEASADGVVDSPPASPPPFDKKALMPSLVMMAMLSVHSVVEGLVVGVQADTDATVALLVAILSHKWVESLSLGLVMAKARGLGRGVFLLCASIFASVTPFGILFGAIAAQNVSTAVVAVFNAIAGGTFLYMGTTGILGAEFPEGLVLPRRERWLKFASALLGAMLISTVRIFTRDDNI